MSEYGPFADEREALATGACAAERAAWNAPGDGEKFNMQMLTSACGELGVELGAYDLSPLRQVAVYETSKCVALRGIIHRAYEAGRAAREEPAAVEWGIVRPEGASRSDDVWGCGRDAEAYVRKLLRDHRSIHGDDAGWLVTRDIGQWKKVPNE